MAHHITKTSSLRDFQKFIEDVYALPDDRLYSLFDLLNHVQRFTMRALKSIRKDNMEQLEINLVISLAWLMAVANRLHVDIEDEVWKRFPALCSYCGFAPCQCKKIKSTSRVPITVDDAKRPGTIAGFQEVFRSVYPPESRTLADAGVHLAEETGEVSEAIHNYLGQHLPEQFAEIELEMADYVSCMFGVANSASINVAQSLGKLFPNNCHVCHHAPCTCTFSKVTTFKA